MFKIKLFVLLTIIYLVESQERDHTRTRNLQVHQRRNERSFRVKIAKKIKIQKKIIYIRIFRILHKMVRKMIQTFLIKF